ncbi:hypothetical protein ACVWXM_000030 [Bradyrhizobium sp. GM7.3]
MVSPDRLAVAMMERLSPPDSRASIIASERMPSSGIWKANGLQRVDREEPVADRDREHDPEREQQQDEGGDCAAAGETDHAPAKREGRGVAHRGALRVRRSRCDQAVAETEMRITKPTKNGDQ